VALSFSGDSGTVTFTPSGGVATSYSISVYSSATSTVTTSSTLVTTVTSSASGQVITFAKENQLYYAVTVVAINPGGNSSASAISSAVQYIPAAPPLAPTNVALSLPAGTVTFTPNGGVATSYSISVYSSATSTVTTSSTLVTTVTSSASGQVITFAKEEQKYYAVTVVAINLAGNSPASAISSAVRYILTAPLEPTNVVFDWVYNNGGNFYLTWKPNGGIASSYNINIVESGPGVYGGTIITPYTIAASSTTVIGLLRRFAGSVGTRISNANYGGGVESVNAVGTSPYKIAPYIKG
jgi:hypothetical protein